MDLSIVIVSYQSKEFLKELLPSVLASKTEYSYEIIIVDNGSNDGTAEWVGQRIRESENQKIGLIRNQNTGYAAGNNLGIKQSKGRYILLLNPDTKLQPSTLETMLDFMENHPEVGVSGCKLIKPGGKLDLACRRRFPNPWNSFQRLFLQDNRNYNYADVDENREMEVDSVVGAFMLIRRELMEKIGLLDEDFFMYGEDLDYCFRCKEAGFKVWYYPKTLAIHYKGESSKIISFQALQWFHNSMWLFYKKHYWQKYPWMLHAIVWLGIKARFLVLTAINLFRKKRFVSR